MAFKNFVKVPKKRLVKIEGLLSCIAANRKSIDFDFFHEVMGLVYVETCGSDAGFVLLNDWAHKVNDPDEVPIDEKLWSIWCMYDDDDQRYFGMSQLIDLAEQPKRKRGK